MKLFCMCISGSEGDAVLKDVLFGALRALILDGAEPYNNAILAGFERRNSYAYVIFGPIVQEISFKEKNTDNGRTPITIVHTVPWAQVS